MQIVNLHQVEAAHSITNAVVMREYVAPVIEFCLMKRGKLPSVSARVLTGKSPMIAVALGLGPK